MIFQKFFVILVFGCMSTVITQFVYLNSGVFKFITGIGLPIDVEMSGGSLSWFSNVQVFYKLPDNISYFEPYKVIQKRSIKNIFNRSILYEALVKYFDRLGFYGNECIYRLICEVASRKINQKKNGLIGEIVQILFSPGDDPQNGLKKYKAAQWQGLYNSSECGLIYKDCYVRKNSIFML